MITAIVPIKNESERLKNKNFLDFMGKPLYTHVLETLQSVDQVDSILVNTNSDIIKLECPKKYSKVIIIDRPAHLLGNHITMNKIIEHDLAVFKGEHFLQTHVTNPLLSKDTITSAIETYFNSLNSYDSLFSVEKIKKRVYDSVGNPINHSNTKLIQTQELPPVYIENSNLFIFSRSSFATAGNSRIGHKPNLFEMSSIEGLDIDYLDDFVLAELIARNKNLFEHFK